MKNKLSGMTRRTALLRRFQPIVVWLLAVVLIGLGGCEKDKNELNDVDSSEDSGQLTVLDAKHWWNASRPAEFRSEQDTVTSRVTVLWDQATIVKYRGTEDIVLVPVSWGNVLNLHDRGRVMLSVFRDNASGSIGARWLGYYASVEEYPHPMSQFNVNTFTGYFFEITSDGYLANILKINNGIITGYHPGANKAAEGDDIDFRCNGFLGINWCCFWPFDTSCCVRCPRFGQNFFELVGDVAADVGGFIAGLFRNVTPGEPDPNFVPGVFHFSPFSNFGHHFGSSETNGATNTGFHLNQYFNNQIFNQTYDPVKAQLIEQFKSDRGITLPSYVLMAIISPYCFDEPESFDECAWWSMTTWINEKAGPLWTSYYDRCLSQLPANETWNRWATLMWRNGALFNYLVANDNGCNGSSIASLATDFNLKEKEACVLLLNPELITPISNFLDGKNGHERELVAEIVHILLEAPTSSHCTTGVTAALIQQIDNFWEQQHIAAGDNELLKDEIIYYLYVRALFDAGDFSAFEEAYLSQEEDLGGTPLTPGEIWAFGSEIKDRLILMYPQKEDRINSFFICRVLAMAFEDVVLGSLHNFDLRNSVIPGSGMTAKPDGYHAISFRGAQSEWVQNGLHVITEVKTKFTSPPVFDWSSNSSQFQQYRTFLENNQYQGTMPNTLYLVLPAGIEVAESVVDACTQQNVLLVTSEVQISMFNPDMVRVSNPVARNVDNLTYHPTLAFPFLAKRFPTNGLKGPSGHFEYNYVDFRQALEERANQFETSYLIGNEDPSCPNE